MSWSACPGSFDNDEDKATPSPRDREHDDSKRRGGQAFGGARGDDDARHAANEEMAGGSGDRSGWWDGLINPRSRDSEDISLAYPGVRCSVTSQTPHWLATRHIGSSAPARSCVA